MLKLPLIVRSELTSKLVEELSVSVVPALIPTLFASASDVIVWDATKSYIRPTAYIKKLT